MNQRKIGFGPGASSLILVIVSLCLSTLAILSLISAKNDLSLSQRSIAVSTEMAEIYADAEKSYGEIDEILADCRKNAASQEEYVLRIQETLPEKYALSDGIITWKEEKGSQRLNCGVTVLAFENQTRAAWTEHRMVSMTAAGWEE